MVFLTVGISVHTSLGIPPKQLANIPRRWGESLRLWLRPWINGLVTASAPTPLSLPAGFVVINSVAVMKEGTALGVHADV